MPACRSWFVCHHHHHPPPPHHHHHHPTYENWLIPKGRSADLGLSVIPIILIIIIVVIITIISIINSIIIIVIIIVNIFLPIKIGSFHNAGLQIFVCLSRLWSAPELQYGWFTNSTVNMIMMVIMIIMIMMIYHDHNDHSLIIGQDSGRRQNCSRGGSPTPL